MARSIKTVSFAALTAIILPFISGCSYYFGARVSGVFLPSQKPILGYVRSGNEREGGLLLLGSLEKQDCEGSYKLSSKGITVFGVALKVQRYGGTIYCLDGRTGDFEYVSETKGRTGLVTGKIGNEMFSVKISDASGLGCNGDEFCIFGVRWSYEKEREDQSTYNKVREKYEKTQVSALSPSP
jgi:hypothetical protein